MTYEFDDPAPNNHNFFKLLIAVVAGIGMLFLLSCHSEKRIAAKDIKAHDKAEKKYTDKSDIDTAGMHWCAVRYPAKVGPGKTTYLPGRKVVTERIDTSYIEVKADTVYTTIKTTRTVYIHDTLLQHDTLIDNNAILLLQAQLAAKDKEVAKSREQIEKAVASKSPWRYATGILSLIVFMLLVGIWLFNKK